MQDFPGASDYAGGIIMYNPYKDYAYYIHGAIWERYYTLGGPNAKTDIEFVLGPPISDIEPYVHTLPPEVSSHGTQFRYQNFEGGALDHDVDTGAVFEVHGAIFTKWKGLGYAAGDLGLVTSDEREAVTSAIGTTGRVSDFEGGHIHWHRNGALANTEFETHGAIDGVYCSEGGSGGWLGFPVSDECVNPSGYAQSDFEGGYITTTDGVIYEAFGKEDTTPPTLTVVHPILHDKMIDLTGTAYDVNGILNNEVLIIVDSEEFDVCHHFFAPYNSITGWWHLTDIPIGYGNNVITVYVQDTNHNVAVETTSVYLDYPDFSFVQITDVHIGCDPLSLLTDEAAKEVEESTSRFTEILDAVGDLNPKPAVLLITGDLVEWNDESFLSAFKSILYNYIVQEKMKGHDISVYCIPGNHDRRKWDPLEDDHLVNYHKFITPGPNIKDEDRFGPDNFSFEYGGYLFIGLDSGKDYSVGTVKPYSPEGSGLENYQMTKLMEMDPNIPKIIFMHHPVINKGNDWGRDPVPNDCFEEHGGNDECIAFNRCEFIEYCTDYNVQLVLTGHTHEAHVFGATGDELVWTNSGGSYPLPYFIQTPSATKDKKCGIWPYKWPFGVIYKHGYRIIDIKNGKAYPQRYTPTGAHSNVKHGFSPAQFA